MLLLSQQGWSASQIADLLGYDPSTVRRWVHRYQRHGTSGLADRPRSGRPRLGSRRLHQRIRRLLHQPSRRTIFGAVDLASGQWFYQVTRKAVSATFTAFCQQLLAAYPTAPLVVVVCDSVIIHRSKIVQQWRRTHPRLLVLHGARYSPHDNPVERVWGALKAWLANNPTLTIQGRIRQVHAFFRQRTTPQMLTTAAPHSSPWLPGSSVQNFRQAA